MAGVRVVAGDALSLLGAQKGAGWDVVFLDPPFETIAGGAGGGNETMFAQALQFAAMAIAPDGVVYLEAPRGCLAVWWWAWPRLTTRRPSFPYSNVWILCGCRCLTRRTLRCTRLMVWLLISVRRIKH